MSRKSWLIFFVVTAFLAVGGAFLKNVQANQKLGLPGVVVAPKPVFDPNGNMVGTNSVDLPEEVLDYTSEARPIQQLVLDWLPKDTTYGQRLYKAADGFEAMIGVVLMGTDRTSIHKPQYCLTGQGWVIDSVETVGVPIPRPQSYDLQVTKMITSREVPLPSGGSTIKRGIFVYWFVADKLLTADHTQRMWSMVTHMMRTGELQRWAYVTCFALCAPGQEDAAFDRIKELLAATVPDFQLATSTTTAMVSGR